MVQYGKSSIIPLNMSHSFLSPHPILNLNIFCKLVMSFKEKEVCLSHGWEICMYYKIDTERNIMLNNFMADMPKAIQMRELITMQAQEISY